jgi:hypothetical protein
VPPVAASFPAAGDLGEDVDRVKASFPWARGALIVEVTEAVAHL